MNKEHEEAWNKKPLELTDMTYQLDTESTSKNEQPSADNNNNMETSSNEVSSASEQDISSSDVEQEELAIAEEEEPTALTKTNGFDFSQGELPPSLTQSFGKGNGIQLLQEFRAKCNTEDELAGKQELLIKLLEYMENTVIDFLPLDIK